MARIKDTKGRSDEDSGYVRLLGNTPLGPFTSRLHATVMRTGNELERMLESATPADRKAELSAALSTAKDSSARGNEVVSSPRITEASNGHDISGNVVVFDHAKKTLNVIEV